MKILAGNDYRDMRYALAQAQKVIADPDYGPTYFNGYESYNGLKYGVELNWIFWRGLQNQTRQGWGNALALLPAVFQIKRQNVNGIGKRININVHIDTVNRTNQVKLQDFIRAPVFNDLTFV